MVSRYLEVDRRSSPAPWCDDDEAPSVVEVVEDEAGEHQDRGRGHQRGRHQAEPRQPDTGHRLLGLTCSQSINIVDI